MSLSKPAPCPCVTHHPTGPALGAYLAPRPLPQQPVHMGAGDRHLPLPGGAQSKPLPRPLSRADRATWRELKAVSPTPSPAPVIPQVCWAGQQVLHGALRPLPLARGHIVKDHCAPWRQSSVVCRRWDLRGAPGAVAPGLRLGAPGHCFVTTCSRGVGVLQLLHLGPGGPRCPRTETNFRLA